MINLTSNNEEYLSELSYKVINVLLEIIRIHGEEP